MYTLWGDQTEITDTPVYLHAYFQVYNTLLLTVVPVLYNESLELILPGPREVSLL